MNKVKKFETLSSNEKIFLFLYEKMYGEKYSAQVKHNIDGTKITHIKGQQAIFSFLIFGVPVGNYYFEWNIGGLCSNELKLVMSSLDSKKNLISKFYKKVDPERLFKNFQLSRIEVACDILSEFVNKAQNTKLTTIEIVNNATAISSLIYISNCVLKNHCFNDVNNIYLSETKQSKQSDVNKKIWKAISKLELVP